MIQTHIRTRVQYTVFKNNRIRHPAVYEHVINGYNECVSVSETKPRRARHRRNRILTVCARVTRIMRCSSCNTHTCTYAQAPIRILAFSRPSNRFSPLTFPLVQLWSRDSMYRVYIYIYIIIIRVIISHAIRLERESYRSDEFARRYLYTLRSYPYNIVYYYRYYHYYSYLHLLSVIFQTRITSRYRVPIYTDVRYRRRPVNPLLI